MEIYGNISDLFSDESQSEDSSWAGLEDDEFPS